jgi:ABC-type transport system substrate-binding protein
MSPRNVRGGVFATTRAGMLKRVTVVAVAALGVAACGSAGTAKPASVNLFNPATFNTNDVPWLAANINAKGSPVYGGTLQVEGSIDLSEMGDPQGEYESIGFEVERTYARQLLSYPSEPSMTATEGIVPDAAASMPTVSPNGLTYTFTLRPGLMWNTTPPRPVTSEDFKRGILRNCDPTLAPDVNAGYYISTIVGFKAYCTPFELSSPSESPAVRASYINAGMTSVSGIQTPNDKTIVFNLTEPAVDFDNLLAMPFASAAPVEYLKYTPLTPGNVLYSDGPYYISTYNIGHEMILSRNPEWTQSSDPIRHQYVNQIDIKLDLAGAAASSEVQEDMQAGTDDLSWNTVVPTADIASLESPTWNPDFGAFPTAGGTNPYLVFNVQSPNNNGALGKVKVRQALEYAIDKVAIGKIYGGASINEPINQVIAPGAEGYVPIDLYPTKSDEGNPGECKSLLKAAGYPNGLTLKYYYRNNGNHPAVFQSVQSDFAKCGVTAIGTPIATGYYGPSGIGVTDANGLKSGQWDITDPGWLPDWFSPTNGRSVLPDLVDGALSFPGSDWGGYDNPAVDALVTQAEAALTVSAAAALWHKADLLSMQDAAIIPIQTQLTALYHSSRVHNAIFNPFIDAYDLTQIWLG